MELADSFVMGSLYAFTTDMPSMQVDVDSMELSGVNMGIGVHLAVLRSNMANPLFLLSGQA